MKKYLFFPVLVLMFVLFIFGCNEYVRISETEFYLMRNDNGDIITTLDTSTTLQSNTSTSLSVTTTTIDPSTPTSIVTVTSIIESGGTTSIVPVTSIIESGGTTSIVPVTSIVYLTTTTTINPSSTTTTVSSTTTTITTTSSTSVTTTTIPSTTTTAGTTTTTAGTTTTTVPHIKFIKNGGSGTMADQIIPSGTSAILTKNIFTRTGYTFTGWSTATSGSVEYVDEDSYTMGFSSVTLYAIWSPDTNTIQFNNNGGTGTMSNISAVTDVPFALPDCTFTKEYWTFIGWATSPAGGRYYKNQETISVNSSLTLYAIWKFDLSYRDMMPVQGGTYTQTDGTISFQHTVDSFNIGKYEITYELWYAVRQWAISNGYNFANAGQEGHDGTGGAAPTTDKYEPVTNVSWRDAIVWCNAYSEMSGFTPCYTYSSQTIKDSRNSNATACDNAECGWNKNGYRLPTEGEWQYAASYIDGASWLPYNHVSGDTTGPYNSSSVLGNYSWYSANSGSSTKTVGTKTPNGLGLYDMSGNVWEWCWDWHDTYYTLELANSHGALSGTVRVLRGGAYTIGPNAIIVGFRSTNTPEAILVTYGFRVAQKGSDYNLRDVGPAGGWIFYDKGSYSNGWRYLEAAPQNMDIANIEWSSGSYNVSTLPDIDAGKQNTVNIVAELNSHGETEKAAQMCDDLVFNGYSDWFMPSSLEIAQMDEILHNNNIGGFSMHGWSSTETNLTSANYRVYVTNQTFSTIKSTTKSVRAVRRF